MTLQDQVREFMAAFGQHVTDKPTVPSDDVVRLRLRLIAEEFFELLESSFADQGGPLVRDLTRGTMGVIDTLRVDVDLPEFVDALADLDYVVEGARLAAGVDGQPIADAVHKANMAKVGGYRDETGKWRKPVGWTPPDIEAELERQGLEWP